MGKKELMMLAFGLLIFLISIIIPLTQAAEIHGNIYDFELNKVKIAVVEINTTPTQKIVTNNGSYSFSVPTGTYKLKAYTKENNIYLKSEELIEIKDPEGSFVLDIVLFPELEINLTSPDQEVPLKYIAEEDKPEYIFPLIVVIIILGIGIITYIILNKRKQKIENSDKELDEDEIKVLEILYRNDKRMSQKEIKREFHYSDAKISMLLDVMEKKGLIKKFKKGRQNIITLIDVDKAKSIVESKKENVESKEENL